MTLVIVAFLAGALTVLAPCILPLLPIIVGGTIASDDPVSKWRRPLVVVGSLAVSVVLFTLLLKATTALLGIPQSVWSTLSAMIVVILGVSLVWPRLWDKLMLRTGLQLKSQQLLGASNTRHGLSRDIILGASLGPVFNSCSPTYALIVATVLPQSLAKGMVYLLAYAAGLSLVLLIVAIAGRAAVRRLGWLSNPEGWFKRVIGLLFLIVGISLFFGLDRQIQTYVLENGWYDPILKLEQYLRF